MERVYEIWNASLLARLVDALCRWCSGQWERSGIVQAFLAPMAGEEQSRSSVFFQLFDRVRGLLCRLYEKLHLEKLFAGSIFTKTWFWCMLPVMLAPLVPTMLVLGLVLVGYCAMVLCLLRDRKRQLAYSPVNRFIILYAAIYLAATFCSSHVESSLKPGILSVAFILFSIVLYNAVTGRRQLDVLLAFVVVSATVVAGYGILQYLFGWGYQSAAWVDSDMFSGISFRVPSTLDNPNMLGQYLILMIPLGGAKLLSSKDMEQRLFYFCCCAIQCVCMLLTFSRGAWLGLLFAGAVFVVLLNPRLILLAPFALIALYFVLPETVISRFTSIGDLSDNSTSYRVYIWMGVLAMLKDGFWLCGIGPGDGAFNQVYPFYSYSAIVAPHSHNLYLQILCDAGITALAVFGLVLFQYFRNLCVAVKDRSDRSSRVLQIAFVAGVCGFLVQAMTDYSFYNYRVMFLFWSYLALGALAAKRSRMPEGGLLK